MACEDRNSANTLTLVQELMADAPRWQYYAALRWLECANHSKPRLGKSRRPIDDNIRLAQQPSTTFAPSTLYQFGKHEKNPELLVLKILFFGMFGPNGPLPLHLTEYARGRIRDAQDKALVEFMDIFHHRLLSLFYRVWADKEPTVHYDRPDSDRFHWYIGSFLGIGARELHDRDEMPDNSKLHFAAHFGSVPHHAEGLSSILRSFFNVPLTIRQFIGEWLKIPEESLCTLGVNGGALGMSTVLGGYSWQRQYKFRILFGPMKLRAYEGLLPGQGQLELVADVVKNYLGYELTCDANLILEKEQVPNTTLGQYGQLGWTTWLHNHSIDQHADDLLLGIRI